MESSFKARTNSIRQTETDRYALKTSKLKR